MIRKKRWKKGHVTAQNYFNECDWGECQLYLTDLSEWQIKLKIQSNVLLEETFGTHNPIITEKDIKLKPSSSNKEDL